MIKFFVCTKSCKAGWCLLSFGLLRSGVFPCYSWWCILHDLTLSRPRVWRSRGTVLLSGNHLCICHVHTGCHWNLPGQFIHILSSNIPRSHLDNIHYVSVCVCVAYINVSVIFSFFSFFYFRNIWCPRRPSFMPQIPWGLTVLCWTTCECMVPSASHWWLWSFSWESSMSTSWPRFSWPVSLSPLSPFMLGQLSPWLILQNSRKSSVMWTVSLFCFVDVLWSGLFLVWYMFLCISLNMMLAMWCWCPKCL